MRRRHPFALGATAALMLALPAGCADDSPAPEATATSPDDAPVLQPGTPGESNSSLTGDDAIATPSRSHSAADVTFLQDMVIHHAQAIVMSDLVEGDLEDEGVRGIASRIAAEQKPEMTAMAQTLRSWGEEVPPQADNPQFGARDDHGSHHGEMPGMASPEDLAALGEAQGADADRRYLDLMITHHQGAIQMCDTLSAGGTDPRTEELADDIRVVQTKQIEQMQQMQARL